MLDITLDTFREAIVALQHPPRTFVKIVDSTTIEVVLAEDTSGTFCKAIIKDFVSKIPKDKGLRLMLQYHKDGDCLGRLSLPLTENQEAEPYVSAAGIIPDDPDNLDEVITAANVWKIDALRFVFS